MNQDIITREKLQEITDAFWKAREEGHGMEFLINLQPKIAKHLEAYGINQLALPNKHKGEFTFIRCAHSIDDIAQESWLSGCESTSVEPNPEEFKGYFLDIESVEEILRTIEKLEAHGIPTSEWHKAQDSSVYFEPRSILTRDQIREIKDGLIKARQYKDMTEYSRLSTKIQKGVVALLESHGVSQIALKVKNRPYYRYIRIMDPDNLDDWGDCFLEMCEWEVEKGTPDPDEFVDTIVGPDTLVAILDRIDRYKELGIPASEWHKAIDLAKYSTNQ